MCALKTAPFIFWWKASKNQVRPCCNRNCSKVANPWSKVPRLSCSYLSTEFKQRWAWKVLGNFFQILALKTSDGAARIILFVDNFFPYHLVLLHGFESASVSRAAPTWDLWMMLYQLSYRTAASTGELGSLETSTVVLSPWVRLLMLLRGGLRVPSPYLVL